VENKTVEMVVKDLLLADNRKKTLLWFDAEDQPTERTPNLLTSMKGTMDPEGARWLTYSICVC